MVQIFNSFGPTNIFGLLQHDGSFDRSTVLGAYFEEQEATNPLKMQYKQTELEQARGGQLERFNDNADQDDPIETPPRLFDRLYQPQKRQIRRIAPTVMAGERQEQMIKDAGLEGHLKATENETEAGLYLLIKWKKEELRRKTIIDHSDDSAITAIAGFGVGLGASMLDPINIAAGLIPFIGPARYSKMLAQQTSRLGRLGVRFRTGALEGAAGATLVEPLVYYPAQAIQYDYNLYNSFANVAFGAVLGGGFHGGLGAIADAIGPVRGIHRHDAKRVEKALESMDEESRRNIFGMALGQVMSSRTVKGADTLARKSVEENKSAVPASSPDRQVLKSPADLSPAAEQSISGSNSIEVTAGDGGNFAISFKTIEEANKKVKQLEKKGFKAVVRSSGEDDHKIDLEIENNFMRKPDGEFLRFSDQKEANSFAKENKDPDVDLHVVKIDDEFFVYKAPKGKGSKEIKQALDASEDIQVPLEVPVVQSINNTGQDPTIQEALAQDIKDANSPETLFGDLQETKIVQEGDQIKNQISDLDETPQVEAEIENLQSEIEIMRREAGDDPKAQKEFDDASEALEKTKETEDAWKQASYCILGVLG